MNQLEKQWDSLMAPFLVNEEFCRMHGDVAKFAISMDRAPNLQERADAAGQRASQLIEGGLWNPYISIPVTWHLAKQGLLNWRANNHTARINRIRDTYPADS